MADYANIKINRSTLRRLHRVQADIALTDLVDLTLSQAIDHLILVWQKAQPAEARAHDPRSCPDVAQPA